MYTGQGDEDNASGFDDMKRSGFWSSVYDLLSMFPYTKAERVVLLEMLCVGTPPVQASNSMPSMRCYLEACLAWREFSSKRVTNC